MPKLMSYPAAMLDYFGHRDPSAPNKTQAFMDELRALTDEDKAEFRQMLTTVGYEIK